MELEMWMRGTRSEQMPRSTSQPVLGFSISPVRSFVLTMLIFNYGIKHRPPDLPDWGFVFSSGQEILIHVDGVQQKRG